MKMDVYRRQRYQTEMDFRSKFYIQFVLRKIKTLLSTNVKIAFSLVVPLFQINDIDFGWFDRY